jgi:hypothetical protein
MKVVKTVTRDAHGRIHTVEERVVEDHDAGPTTPVGVGPTRPPRLPRTAAEARAIARQLNQAAARHDAAKRRAHDELLAKVAAIEPPPARRAARTTETKRDATRAATAPATDQPSSWRRAIARTRPSSAWRRSA